MKTLSTKCIIFCTTAYNACISSKFNVDVLDCSYDDNEIDGIYCGDKSSCAFVELTLTNQCDETLVVEKLDCSGERSCSCMYGEFVMSKKLRILVEMHRF